VGRLAAGLFAAALATGALAAQLAAQTTCADDPAPGEPHPDLYCIPLTPTSRAGAASGAARLLRHPSPFGVSVTPGGVQRWKLAIALADLPEPSSLGPYTTYVAWATTPILRPIVKLGAVGVGEATLGPVALNQFMVLISAEASAEVEARAGPLVLRGASASARMQPHEIAAALATVVGGAREAATPSGAPPGEQPAAPGAHADHAPAPAGAAGDWSPPPMHPEVPMPPGLMELRPDVAPYLPDTLGGGIVFARPARTVDLADGDTLDLVAGRVRRKIGGRTYVMYGFNEMYPGPLVRVERGSTIVVRFENRTEWPTAVHWHGVRVENRFDGVPFVTQEPIPPGGQFVYEVRFPDSGIYWYHPHHREDVQQDLGLYGNLRVREPDDRPPVHREEILMLDDLLVGEDGLVPWGREAATHALMGRFGNVMLVNGEPGWHLAVDRGEVVRFYLTNASNTRTWNVSFDGAAMKLVAADLSPFEREERVESVVLAPAERYVVDVLFEEPGRRAFVNRVQAIDAFGARFFAEVDTLGTVDVGDTPGSPDHAAAFDELHENAGVIAELDRLREAFARPVDHELLLTLEARDLPFPVAPLLATEWTYVHPVEWSGTMPEMNWVSTGRSLRWILRDPATGKENEEIEWRFRQGDLVKIRLTSDRDALHPMHHPIHLHGQRFLVLAQGGTRNDNLAWKDTLLLPTGDAAEILVEMSNPGLWMLHCHISEHLEAGMKTVLTVDPVGERPSE
jgi:FtsP/CotA-like multicopper oxidase with cupredoxin domain